MPKLTATALLLLWSIALAAQSATCTISGKVLTADNQPAEYINVFVKGTSLGSVTDSKGTFTIRKVPAGPHTLVVSHVGLEPKEIMITVTTGTNTIEDIVLSESSTALDAITVTGTKINQFDHKDKMYVARMPLENLENPQVYTSITSALMQEQQVTDIQSALANAPGVSSVGAGIGSGGTGLNLYIRGFSADMAMRNGLATNFRSNADPANLEELEVIKGPSGTLYGAQVTSYGGVLNRITKQPKEYFTGSASYSTGNNSLSRLTADINVPLTESKNVLFRLNLAKHYEHSFQDFGMTRNWFIAPNLLFKASDRLTFSVEAEIYHNSSPANYFRILSNDGSIDNLNDLNYQFGNSYSSDALHSESDIYNVFAKAIYKLSDQWTSTTVLSSGNTDNNANYLFIGFLGTSQLRRDLMNIQSQFNTLQIQQNFNGDFHIGSMRNRLLAGLDYYSLKTPYKRTGTLIYDTVGYTNTASADINMNSYQNTLGSTTYSVGTRDYITYSAYASDVLNITDALLITASLRADYFDNKQPSDYTQLAFSPKFGAVYEILSNQLSAFANVMDGFTNVAPSTLTTGGMQTFDPEHATQYEAGFKSELFNKKLSATISYYDILVRNVVRTVTVDGESTQVQDGERVSRGMELELITNPLPGFNLVGGYGHNHSEYTKAAESVQGNRPYAVPNNTLNFWASYYITSGVIQGLGAGFGGNYTSDTYLTDTDEVTVPAYTVLNASLFYKGDSYRIGLKINNLGNTEYWTAMGGVYALPQKTRNAVLTFSYNF